jgi:hypothetical protein
VVLGRRIGRVGWITALAGVAALTAGGILASADGTASASAPAAVANAGLNGVSCVTAKFCLAVGGRPVSRRSAGGSVVERWNGQAWSAVAVPKPASGHAASLQSVTCTSTRNCIAAGYYIAPGGTLTGLALHWNGTKWSVTPVPVPRGRPFSQLYGATCVRATDCWAVGNAGSATLAERWNGSKWSLVPSPSPHPASPNQLSAVACVNASECWAVGYTFPGAGTGSLTEKWNGDAWRVVSTPSSKSGDLIGDSCPSPTACLAVGASDGSAALAQIWTGTKWVGTPAARPRGATAAQLSAVACPSQADCLAVGYYSARGRSLVLAQRWTGTRWVAATAASPAGASFVVLNGATCLSASNCWAVGRTVKDSATSSLIEHWNGRSWSVS